MNMQANVLNAERVNSGGKTTGAQADAANEMADAGLRRPTRAQAEAAVATLIRWAGDDPSRPGLADTPARVARAYEEWFAGYAQNPAEFLLRTFDEIGGYVEPVELRDISFLSYCEHHMAPIRGRAHIAYLPRGRVVGISKLVRLVEALAHRLQIQERLTDQIARAIDDVLKPRGVAVAIEAEHGCMTSRGVNAHSARMVTRRMLGAYETEPTLRRQFLMSVGS